MRRIFWILVVLFEFWICPVVIGQILDFKYKQLPNLDKLTSRSVTCMAQDSTGFIWIGTVDGLNRYNGYEVDVYRTSGKKSVGLPSNEITCIFVDSKNRIWVGTPFGISVFNSSKDEFILVESAVVGLGFRNLIVNGIAEDNFGRVLAAAGNSVYSFNEISNKFDQLIESPNGEISAILVDSANDLWLGHWNGRVAYCSFKNGTYSAPEFLNVAFEKINKNWVSGLVINENSLWIGSQGDGLLRYNLKTKATKHFLTEHSDRSVVSVYIDRNKNLWTCDYNGLKQFNPTTDTFLGAYHNPSELNSIRPDIKGIFQDRQGNYYFYYKGEGIYVSYVERGFRQFNTSPLWFWHTQSGNIMSICEQSNGSLWLGQFNGGIDIFDWVNTRMVHYSNYEGDPIRLGAGTIFKIHRDSKGTMWIGSHAGGLRSFDPLTQKVKIYEHNPNDPNSISGNDVRSLSEDKAGNFWIGVHGKGVSYFNRNNGIFKNYNAERNNLASDWVESVLYDSRGFLWVGSTGGLSLLSHGDSIFRNIQSIQGSPKHFYGSKVVCLHETRKGEIWLGTNEGIYRMDPKSFEFTRFAEHALNQYICSIEEDHNGMIWFSTLDGLFRLNSETGVYFQFDENDGLQGSGFNSRASYSNGLTELLFAGTKGANIFNADALRFNNTAPQIIFSKFSLFNKEVVDFSPDGILEKHISVSDEITLDYDQNVFSIGFTAMNMINPERNIYAYIMEGFETEWNYGETKREVTYTNLDPGKYIFRVKAANNDGVWNEEGISLQINVLPPWYRTNLFYVSLFLLLMAAPFTYYRLRTSALRRQKRRLTQVVAEKTLKLRKNNEALKLRTVELNRINYILEERQQVIEHQSTELENQASNLKQTNLELHKLNNTKDRLFSIIAHDLRSPFNTILGFSDLLIESVDKEDINQISNYARFVHDASLQVFNLLENLLCWARSQTNEIKYNPTNTDLDEIVHDNLDLLKESFLKKELKVVTDGYENYPVFVDLDMLRTILRNLLINAIKFTPKGGVISLKTEKLGNLVKLSVIDNGVGISKEDLQLLTIAGEQRNTKGTDGEFGSGLGLVLCNEFIIRNNGRLVIESEPGKGSTFSVLLPIK